ncbi:Cysteine-rich RLK (receptor-like protein kinase) 8 [Cucumis melo var. makuwa]|uniref:Cysteine-rich RLK (Receptor-like protein kinase) 8 n=1 Tax=Cucumis melo var. makuwa TaxID=1194695 RepID=A0A5A7V378_CUCMM|nr:Cysteine-rich RLK (receptor-like protein kinase) 8 [Cucumis melo var. makuwa]TYK22075.1 Cysteine-rich RLK (receptor-like protein kinase) 8 [Cucumis melo var. makuwa]
MNGLKAKRRRKRRSTTARRPPSIAWIRRQHLFTGFVESEGYSQRYYDHTLFTKVSKAGKIAVLIVQFIQSPYEELMEVVNKILRYLKMTHGSVVDRKSTSSYCTFVRVNLITCGSKKQSAMARGYAEAK